MTTPFPPTSELHSVECYSCIGHSKPDLPLPCNEDGFLNAPGLVAVFDGAAPAKGKAIGKLTPAAFLVQFSLQRLHHYALDPALVSLTARDLLIRINDEYRERILTEMGRLPGKDDAAASVAMVRFTKDGTYTWAHTGDCALCEVGSDGSILQIPDTIVTGNEQERLTYLQEQVLQGLTFAQAVASDHYAAMWREHVATRNVTRPCFNGEEGFRELCHGGERSTSGMKGLVLLSDGMELPESGFSKSSFGAAAREIWENGTGAYGERLRTLYDNDPTRQKYFRFKHRDDATALVVRYISAP